MESLELWRELERQPRTHLLDEGHRADGTRNYGAPPGVRNMPAAAAGATLPLAV